jgi:hypothetical protein
MADTGIFATTAEVIRKAGANASSVSATEAYINDYMTQAESFINCVTRYNWSDAYSSLDADVRGLLKLAASNMAAIYVIEYDMSGFSSRTEAENMINILWDAANSAISLLKDQKTVIFIQEA